MAEPSTGDGAGRAPAAPFGPGVSRFVEGARGGSGAAPAPAATVVLLRDAPAARAGGDGARAASIEVFLVERATKLPFMGGAHVFPGGKVDAKDPNAEAAAVREVEEEVAVRLDVRALRPWSRWITPEIEPRRFDATFFLAALPRGEEARAVPGEVVGGLWLAPAEAVLRAERGAIALPPPTLWTLLELTGFASVANALAAAPARAPLPTFAPRAVELPGGRLALVLAGDPCYDDPMAAPPEAAQRRFVLDDGRWLVFGGPGGRREPGAPAGTG